MSCPHGYSSPLWCKLCIEETKPAKEPPPAVDSNGLPTKKRRTIKKGTPVKDGEAPKATVTEKVERSLWTNAELDAAHIMLEPFIDASTFQIAKLSGDDAARAQVLGSLVSVMRGLVDLARKPGNGKLQYGFEHRVHPVRWFDPPALEWNEPGLVLRYQNTGTTRTAFRSDRLAVTPSALSNGAANMGEYMYPVQVGHPKFPSTCVVCNTKTSAGKPTFGMAPTNESGALDLIEWTSKGVARLKWFCPACAHAHTIGSLLAQHEPFQFADGGPSTITKDAFGHVIVKASADLLVHLLGCMTLVGNKLDPDFVLKLLKPLTN